MFLRMKADAKGGRACKSIARLPCELVLDDFLHDLPRMHDRFFSLAALLTKIGAC